MAENNGKEKVPRKSEKMPKYMPNLHYIMPNLLHLHINKLTLSIMCHMQTYAPNAELGNQSQSCQIVP
jgi:hypothetical protein